jgi:hypothetical protein
MLLSERLCRPARLLQGRASKGVAAGYGINSESVPMAGSDRAVW